MLFSSSLDSMDVVIPLIEVMALINVEMTLTSLAFVGPFVDKVIFEVIFALHVLILEFQESFVLVIVDGFGEGVVALLELI